MIDHPDKPRGPEVVSFDVGVRLIRAKITELLASQDDVVFAINGSAPEVGKTHLAGEISKSFFMEKIPSGTCTNYDDLLTAAMNLHFYREQMTSQKGIYIFEGINPPHGLSVYGDTHVRPAYDARLKRAAKELRLDLERIDVWAAIYTPDKPHFHSNERLGLQYEPFEDVIICNEEAISED